MRSNFDSRQCNISQIKFYIYLAYNSNYAKNIVHFLLHRERALLFIHTYYRLSIEETSRYWIMSGRLIACNVHVNNTTFTNIEWEVRNASMANRKETDRTKTSWVLSLFEKTCLEESRDECNEKPGEYCYNASKMLFYRFIEKFILTLLKNFTWFTDWPMEFCDLRALWNRRRPHYCVIAFNKRP